MENLQVLGGSSLPLPEQDDPNQNQLNYESSVEYDSMEIVSSIGTSEFKTIYTLFINDIKQQPIVDQRRWCLDILEKIKKVYNFEFLPPPDLDDQLQLNDVYDLIKFINYDYTDFFGDVWRYIDIDLKKIDIEEYCNKHSDEILEETEDQIHSGYLSKMVSLFLRTYNKEDFIDWFIKSTKKQKMLIYLRTLEEN